LAKIKFTKNELRDQQHRLEQLQRYLPTLRLKKAMLQSEVQNVKVEIAELSETFAQQHREAEDWAALLATRTSVDPHSVAKVREVHRRYENIAGVDIPYYESVAFEEVIYSLFETPPWVDGAMKALRELVETHLRIVISKEKKAALERELREVSIRVNLFEKVLIPRALKNIRKIKVFLGDQELSAVSQAKVAKNKIQARLKAREEVLNAC